MSGPLTPQATESFLDYATTRRAEIEVALLRVLPRPPVCPPLVAEAMRYSVEVGGKRLRPILTLSAAEAIAWSNGRRSDEQLHDARRLAMPAACAVEMIHTYSLVHDDLPAMDNDSTRRGRPTLHVVYGEGLAILAGDGLMAEAFALLAEEPESDHDPELTRRKLRVLRAIGQAVGAGGMVGGQAIDLESSGLVKTPPGHRLAVDAEVLRDMHARKTGVLIRAAAVAGAVMAGGTPAQIDAVDRYAAEIGLVFQIVDDVLDVEGTPEVLGKTPGKDAARGKLTYPALYGLARSRELAAEGLARAGQALADAGVSGRWLMDIAQWVVKRQC